MRARLLALVCACVSSRAGVHACGRADVLACALCFSRVHTCVCVCVCARVCFCLCVRAHSECARALACAQGHVCRRVRHTSICIGNVYTHDRRASSSSVVRPTDGSEVKPHVHAHARMHAGTHARAHARAQVTGHGDADARVKEMVRAALTF